jgi:drug/metabolite transporter (DMT)-like permease
MVVALSLAVAVFYGAADFCGGLATRRASALAVVVWSQAAGLLVLLAALPFVPGVLRPSDLVVSAVCGVCGTLAVGLLYRGLAIGVMGVVSPITAVLCAALPVAWGIGRGERPAALALVGIAFALVAVVLVSAATPAPAEPTGEPAARRGSRGRIPPGIPEALGAGVAFGIFFIALAQVHRDAGLYPLLGTRVISMLLLLGAAFALRRPLRVARPGLPTIALCGALDMGANVLYIFAAHAGALSIVAVLSSLYPAATVALAGLVLRERLVRTQWAGVGVAFAGVLCISLAR